MNNHELTLKVHSAMCCQCKSRGFAAPVDVLMDTGLLTKQDYEAWRNGRIDCLERVCRANLSKLSLIMREMRGYARENGLKPSFTVYKRQGTGKKNAAAKKTEALRFSKSGAPDIERWYATHFVDTRQTALLKEKKLSKNRTRESDNIKQASPLQAEKA